MNPDKDYTKAEHQFLGSLLPTHVELTYLSTSQEYQLKHKLLEDKNPRILASRPRNTVMKYQVDPRKTLAYIARRAMMDKGLPVEMKRK